MVPGLDFASPGDIIAQGMCVCASVSQLICTYVHLAPLLPFPHPHCYECGYYNIVETCTHALQWQTNMWRCISIKGRCQHIATSASDTMDRFWIITWHNNTHRQVGREWTSEQITCSVLVQNMTLQIWTNIWNCFALSLIYYMMCSEVHSLASCLWCSNGPQSITLLRSKRFSKQTS